MTEQLHFCFSLSCIGEGNGTPFQHSCLENPRDGGAWWAAVYGVAQSRTRLKRLSSSNSSKHCILRIYWDSIYLLSFHSIQLKWFLLEFNHFIHRELYLYSIHPKFLFLMLSWMMFLKLYFLIFGIIQNCFYVWI